MRNGLTKQLMAQRDAKLFLREVVTPNTLHHNHQKCKNQMDKWILKWNSLCGLWRHV